MCLDKVTKRYERPTKKEVFAYKVFNVFEGKYCFEFYGDEVPTGEWLRSSTKTLRPDYRDPYPSGFHGIRTKAGAVGWADEQQAIVRVRMRYVQVEGPGIGGENIVAREMYVPKPRSRPSPLKGRARYAPLDKLARKSVQ